MSALALAMNPGANAERYERYAHTYANSLGVLWRKPVKGVAGQASGRAGKGTYSAGSAFETENGEKVIESPTPNTLGNLYLWMHELSHHYLGHLNSDLPYHVEEYEATKEAIDTMERDGITMTPKIKAEAAWNIKQAIKRDRRNGVPINVNAQKYVELLEGNK
jgi:hypothetical protein